MKNQSINKHFTKISVKKKFHEEINRTRGLRGPIQCCGILRKDSICWKEREQPLIWGNFGHKLGWIGKLGEKLAQKSLAKGSGTNLRKRKRAFLSCEFF